MTERSSHSTSQSPDLDLGAKVEGGAKGRDGKEKDVGREESGGTESEEGGVDVSIDWIGRDGEDAFEENGLEGCPVGEGVVACWRDEKLRDRPGSS